MAEAAYLLQHGYRFLINKKVGAKDSERTWLRLAAGIKSITPDNNEEVSEDYYYDGGGNAESGVTGMQKTYSFEGHRKYGDPAQDYIYDTLSHGVGPEREVEAMIIYPDGNAIKGKAIIVNIKDPGGDANSKGEIEFNLNFSGMPTKLEKMEPSAVEAKVKAMLPA